MRSPKSPARKKARVWKAWAVVAKDDGSPLWIEEEALLDCFSGRTAAIYESRRDAREDLNDGERVVRVTIREILPAPVPPRSRKSKGGGK